MAEKGIRDAIYQYVKANNKFMKDYDESKESLYLNYWDVNNLYGQAMSQKLPVDGFKQLENTFQFNKDFIKSYNEDSEGEYFIEVDVQYPEKLQ